MNCMKGCTSQSKEGRTSQTERKECVEAQRHKKGTSRLKELQVRASKRQGVLLADGGRQSRRGRQEADGRGFLCPALESSLTLGSEWGPLEDLTLEGT